MTDTWSQTQQRTHNHNTFAQMQTVWFPARRVRGRKYQFSDRQMQIALAVVEKQKEIER